MRGPQRDNRNRRKSFREVNGPTLDSSQALCHDTAQPSIDVALPQLTAFIGGAVRDALNDIRLCFGGRHTIAQARAGAETREARW